MMTRKDNDKMLTCKRGLLCYRWSRLGKHRRERETKSTSLFYVRIEQCKWYIVMEFTEKPQVSRYINLVRKGPDVNSIQ